MHLILWLLTNAKLIYIGDAAEAEAAADVDVDLARALNKSLRILDLGCGTGGCG